jgi:hypothetical protein
MSAPEFAASAISDLSLIAARCVAWLEKSKR